MVKACFGALHPDALSTMKVSSSGVLKEDSSALGCMRSCGREPHLRRRPGRTFVVADVGRRWVVKRSLLQETTCEQVVAECN